MMVRHLFSTLLQLLTALLLGLLMLLLFLRIWAASILRNLIPYFSALCLIQSRRLCLSIMLMLSVNIDNANKRPIHYSSSTSELEEFGKLNKQSTHSDKQELCVCVYMRLFDKMPASTH